MTSNQFIESIVLSCPNLSIVSNTGRTKKEVESWNEYALSVSRDSYRFIVEDIRNRLNETIVICNFQIYNMASYVFDETFEQDGFYPFGFYYGDHLFINLKTNRVEARDLVLTKYYDVAKDEEAFLEAFLIFAKQYSFSLENPMDQPDYYSLYLSTSLDTRREILDEVLKTVGGKKYGPFWVQVFQAWTDEELREMGE